MFASHASELATTLLLVILAVAMSWDLATRRIPNILVLAGLVAGLLLNTLAAHGGGFWSASPGGLGLGMAASGAAVGLAILLPAYALGTLGAGDVKLMAAVGTFLGPLPAAGATFLTLAAGGVLAIAVAVGTKSLRRVTCNLLFLIHPASRAIPGAGTSVADRTTGRLPYSLAIAAGTVLQMILGQLPSHAWPFS
jgi:prepilin peptidase CpaA